MTVHIQIPGNQTSPEHRVKLSSWEYTDNGSVKVDLGIWDAPTIHVQLRHLLSGMDRLTCPQTPIGAVALSPEGGELVIRVEDTEMREYRFPLGRVEEFVTAIVSGMHVIPDGMPEGAS